MKDIVLTFGKAITATVGTAVTGLGVAMIDGDLTRTEGIAALGAGIVVGFGAIWAPYRPTK